MQSLHQLAKNQVEILDMHGGEIVTGGQGSLVAGPDSILLCAWWSYIFFLPYSLHKETT